jgi:hypothetical protein
MAAGQMSDVSHSTGAEDRFTAEELLDDASRVGLPATKRLITDWAAKGLLDRPTRRGLGRGKGIVATWSDGQRQLFRTLLVQRQRGHGVAPLCNIPVAHWLYFDDGTVPIRQVQRAMVTWSGGGKTRSWHRARRSAALLVDQIQHPEARRQSVQQLKDMLATAAYNGDLDAAELQTRIAAVFDPRDEGRRLGSQAVSIRAGDVVAYVTAQFAALQQLTEFPDDLYVWARVAHRTNLGDYLRDRQLLAADPDIGDLFTAPSNEELVNQACHHVLMNLGLRITAPQFQIADHYRQPTTNLTKK